MDVGIGLPATIPGVEGKELTAWARRAEERGFSSLGVIDRLVYPNYEPLISLAAAAAVTERIRLVTDILLVPFRVNAALVAKQAATVHHLSGGRLVLGAAIGGREDDYQASRVPFEGRARRFEDMLDEMKRAWAGDEIGPSGASGAPPLLIGGYVDAAIERAASYGDGWTMGGGTPDDFKQAIEKLRSAWSDAGREGKPRTMALAYFSLGDDAERNADRYLHDYYAWLGDVADQIAGSAATDADTVKQYAQAFADAGADEFILFPCSTGVEQVDLLADVLAGSRNS